MESKTITITEFGGPLTRRNNGDINSGLTKFDTSWGYDPYSKPGNLSWMEQPSSILAQTSGAGPLVIMKVRNEGTSNYVYALANNRNLYKIQVNTGGVANYDIASVIGA